MIARSPEQFRNVDVVSKRYREVINVSKNFDNTVQPFFEWFTSTMLLRLVVVRGSPDFQEPTPLRVLPKKHS